MHSRVSVIVPIYNAEKYLVKCLDSITKQTLPEIEILCVNDGSTDRSLDIIKHFSSRDRRISIINKENSGYGDSLNKAMRRAGGKYLGIIESDDYTEPGMFEDLYSIAERENVDIVKSDFFETTQIDRQARALPQDDVGHVIRPCDSVAIFKTQPSIWSAIYKREFLKTHNINFLTTPGASFQDTSFSLKVLTCADRVFLTPEAYVHYRRDNPGSSINSADKVFAVCDEYDEFERFLGNYPNRRRKIINVLQSVKFETYCWNLLRLNEIGRQKFLPRMFRTFQDALSNNLLQKDCFTVAAWGLLHLLLEQDPSFINRVEEEWKDRYGQ